MLSYTQTNLINPCLFSAIILINALGQQVAAATYGLRGEANEFQVPIAGLAPGMCQLVGCTPASPPCRGG